MESEKEKDRRERVRVGCEGCGRLLSDCTCSDSEPHETPWSRGDDEDLSDD